MRKSTRLTLTGSMQGIFFKQFIKEHADKNKVKGFLRQLENGKMEIFLEGLYDNVDAMISICKRGPKHASIRSVEEKEERFQDFKDFKILNF